MLVLFDGIYKYNNKYVRIYWDDVTHTAFYRNVVAGKRNKFIFASQTKHWMGFLSAVQLQVLYYGPNNIHHSKTYNVLLKIRLMDQRFKERQSYA